MSGIGHNNPPDPIDEATAKWAGAIHEAEGWLDGEPVQTDEQEATVTELLREIKAAIKSVNAARDEATRPLHEAWKAEVARWKPTQDDLDRIAKGLAKITEAHRKRRAAEKEAARRAAWEQAEAARRAAAEAQARADAADIEAQREAARLAAEAQAAKQAASAAQRDRQAGLRTVHMHEVTNHQAAMLWIAENDKPALLEFIEQYAAKHHRAAPIAGVRTWTEQRAF